MAMYYILWESVPTSVQPSVAQWGGHFSMLHCCVMIGCFSVHSSISTISVCCWLILRTQCAVRVLLPPPQDTEHSVQALISHLYGSYIYIFYYTPTLLCARITHFQPCTITQSSERISGQKLSISYLPGYWVFARILRFGPLPVLRRIENDQWASGVFNQRIASDYYIVTSYNAL